MFFPIISTFLSLKVFFKANTGAYASIALMQKPPEDPFESGRGFSRITILIVISLCLTFLLYIIPLGFRLREMPPQDQFKMSAIQEFLNSSNREPQIVPLDRHSKWLILQAYNAGPEKVISYNGIIRYPETVSYVERAFNLLGEPSLPTPYNDIIEEIAPYFGLDPRLVKTVVLLESGGEADLTSRQGARGLMQVKRSSWEDMANKLGVNWSFEEAFDPYKNIIIGCAYLEWLRDIFLKQRNIKALPQHEVLL